MVPAPDPRAPDHPRRVRRGQHRHLPWFAEYATANRLAHRRNVYLREALERDPEQEAIAECERKLANYRSLLDAGTDPTVVGGWIAEVTGQRVRVAATVGR